MTGRDGTPRWRRSVACLAMTMLVWVGTSGPASARCDAGPAGEPEGDRPRVGVALSGGGARGVAQVGVLRALVAQGVPIDCIAGTSMGAVVGGLFAAGLELDAIEALLERQDWDALFEDRIAYRDRSMRGKRLRRRYRFGFGVTLARDGIRLPSGISAGQRLGAALQTALIQVPSDFDALPIPFRAVATDIETGTAVVPVDGSLADAIQASATVPGVLAPIEIGGRLLVDGGLVNNLPVDVVRAMGADLVVAVDVSEPLMPRENLDSLVAITWQVVGIQTRGTMTARLADADVVLTPMLDGFTSASFDRLTEIVLRGEAVVTDQAEGLARLPRVVMTEPPPSPRSFDLRSVRFVGLERVDPRRLRAVLRRGVGRSLDPLALGVDLDRLLALGLFTRVTVRRDVDPDGVDVVFAAEERDDRWRLNADLHLRADLDGETAFRGLIGITRRALNRRGGVWRTDLWGGEPQGVHSELFQPLDWGGRYVAVVAAGAERRRQDIYQGRRKEAELEVEHRTVSIDLGRRWGNHTALDIGVVAGTIEAFDAVGLSGLAARDDDLGFLRARLRIDTTDDRAFPRRGIDVHATWRASQRGLGADRTDRRATFDLAAFVPIGRVDTLFAGVTAGRRLGDVPLPDDAQFRLGGLFSLGGHPVDRFRGDALAVGRLGYLRQIARLPAGLGGRVMAGLMAEWGTTWARPEDARLADFELGVTAFFGADTLLGPLLLGYGRAERGVDRFYLVLGRGLR